MSPITAPIATTLPPTIETVFTGVIRFSLSWSACVDARRNVVTLTNELPHSTARSRPIPEPPMRWSARRKGCRRVSEDVSGYVIYEHAQKGDRPHFVIGDVMRSWIWRDCYGMNLTSRADEDAVFVVAAASIHDLRYVKLGVLNTVASLRMIPIEV